jgi:hypothetical protein
VQGQPTAAPAIVSNLVVPFEGIVEVPLSDDITDSVELTGAIHVKSVLQPVDPCRCQIEVNLHRRLRRRQRDRLALPRRRLRCPAAKSPPISESVDFFLLIPPNPIVPPNPTVPPNPVVPPNPILPLRVTLEFVFDGAALIDVTVGEVTIPSCGVDVCPE